MVRLTETEFISFQTDLYIQEFLINLSSMAKEASSLLIADLGFQDSLSMVIQSVMENKNSTMVVNIKGHLKMDRSMVKEFIDGKMGCNMKVNLLMEL